MRWHLNLPGRRDKDAPPPGDRVPVPERRITSRLDAIQERQLSSVFEPPKWLRDLGRAAWLLVGVVLLVAGLVWLVAKTATITVPVLLGLVIATVASPLVNGLQRRRVPRAIGALIVLLGLLCVAVLVLVLVLGGIVAQSDEIAQAATAAADKAQAWVQDAGVDADGASNAKREVEKAVPEIGGSLVQGVVKGISGLTSLAFALSFTIFALFFLLKDGPAFRGWVDRHLGVPHAVAQVITGDVITSLRRYFTGVTIVAAFNGVVVGIGAVLLDVPLAGTIAVVTYVTAYVPFIGAFVSGAFAVVLALGSGGTSTALVMLVIVLLANGMLQNVVQPIAFGATLNLNPLLVLVVTIAAGSLFGMFGLILAAPLVSAAVHIVKDVGEIRTAEVAAAAEAQSEAGPSPPVPA
ncbi:MAG: AI-2E family transporter [Pseudomonadota bacterium]